MKKIYVGIDISKEKCNLCFRSGLEIVREEECSNDVKALKKAFKVALKVLGASVDEVLVCAEYTGRYIYPLTVACQELDIFLWLDDCAILSKLTPCNYHPDPLFLRYCPPDRSASAGVSMVIITKLTPGFQRSNPRLFAMFE